MTSATTTLAAMEEARLEQAAAAAQTARRNQPKVLLLMAGALLLGALIYLAVSFFQRQAALEELEEAQKQAQNTVTLAGKLNALKAAASMGTANVGVSLLRTRIEQVGLESNLTNPVKLPTTRPETAPPGATSRKVNYDYDITDPSLPALLAWLQRSVAAVPGLEVYSISLRPELHQWKLRVTFSRWEKVEGS